MLWALVCFILLLVVLSIDNTKELKKRGKRSEEISGVGFFLYSEPNDDGGDEGGCDGM